MRPQPSDVMLLMVCGPPRGCQARECRREGSARRKAATEVHSVVHMLHNKQRHVQERSRIGDDTKLRRRANNEVVYGTRVALCRSHGLLQSPYFMYIYVWKGFQCQGH